MSYPEDHYHKAEQLLAEAKAAGAKLEELAAQTGGLLDSRVVDAVGQGVDRTVARAHVHAILATVPQDIAALAREYL